jgi:hypothetical protein
MLEEVLMLEDPLRVEEVRLQEDPLVLEAPLQRRDPLKGRGPLVLESPQVLWKQPRELVAELEVDCSSPKRVRVQPGSSRGHQSKEAVLRPGISQLRRLDLESQVHQHLPPQSRSIQQCWPRRY